MTLEERMEHDTIVNLLRRANEQIQRSDDDDEGAARSYLQGIIHGLAMGYTIPQVERFAAEALAG